jgi:GH35 family endo-1,4-beta-xylanase
MECISSLFKWARIGDPNVPLFYNDYNIEPFGVAKNNFMTTMVKE